MLFLQKKKSALMSTLLYCMSYAITLLSLLLQV